MFIQTPGFVCLTRAKIFYWFDPALYIYKLDILDNLINSGSAPEGRMAMARKFLEGFLAVVLIAVLFLEQIQPVTAYPAYTVQQQDGTSPTPTETSVGTPISTETTVPPTTTPEATQTGTETVAPSTATPEATLTPADAGITQVPVPSETPATPDGPAQAEPVKLILVTDPAFAPRSGKVHLAWEVRGLSEFEPERYEIQLSLPDGLMPEGSSGVDGKTNGQVLSLPLKELSGYLDLLVQEDFPGPFVITAVLLQKDSEIAKAEYVLEKAPGQSIDKSGGVATGLDDRVWITFPADALDEASTVWINAPASEHLPASIPSPLVFEVVAQNASKNEVQHKFAKSLQFDVVYDPAAFPQYREDALTLLWYNEEFQAWDPILSQVDTKSHVIHAWVNHLSLFAVGVDNIAAALPPFLDNIQTGGYTGALTYSIPIQLPAGPGGLQPSLSLNYNSQVVDQSTTHTQASWVGMGWSLDTGRITRDFHGTPDNLDDDTYNISLNGLNGTIVLDTDGKYHTTNETFWQISLSNDSWTVKDRVGNEYIFTSKAKFPTYWSPNGVCNFRADVTWAWMLTSARNQFRSEPNNVILYNYSVSAKYGGVSLCAGSLQNMQTAVFLDSIVYPQSRYRISFGRAGRNDYLSIWDINTGLRVPFEKEYLTEIRIEQDATGGGTYSIVRKYVLTYESNPANRIFPGADWPAQTTTPTKADYPGMLTLTSVQEFGLNNAVLPATVFTYSDNMHLTKVENGYGGKVEFTYDLWFQTPSGSSNSYKIDVGSRELRNSSYSTDVNYQNSYTHPGAVYHVYATFETGDAGTKKVGLTYSVGANQNTWYGPEYTGDSAEGYFLMPVNTLSLADALVYCSYCRFKTLLFEMLPIQYRVVAKKVYDGIEGQIGDQPAIFTYQYDGGAVNDSTHSQYIKDYPNFDDNYVPRYGEFRGNVAVTEVGPDSRATTTIYQQDDIFRGQVIYSYTANQEYVQTFNVTKYPGSAPYGYTVGGTVNMTLPDFWSDPNNSAEWECTGSGTAARVDLEGDEAFALSNAKTVNRKSAASHIIEKKSAILQFRTAPSTTGNIRQLLLTVNSGGISLGISVRRDASGNPYIQSECTGCSGFTSTIIVPTSLYKDNTWYLLFLVVDQGKVHLQVRARNDRAVYARSDLTIPTQQGRTWYFSAENSAGFTSYLDTYQEGELHSFTLNTLQSYKPANIDYPRRINGTGAYPTINIYWTYSTAVATFTYSGADYQSAMTEYSYDMSLQGGVQYGNVTDIYQNIWVNNTWVRYLRMRKGYFPRNDTTNYIVGLPAYDYTYKCADFTCPTDVGNIIAFTGYLYDTNTGFDQAPTAGVLKTKRLLAWYADTGRNDPRYQDTSYQYDTWGNVIQATRYTQEGTVNAVGGGTPVVTTTYYDPFYHTYPTAITDALGYTTTIDYDYALGVPIRETGPNGIHGRAWATYDNFGRITALYRGDDGGTASLSVVYSDTNPFWMQVTQKITDSQNAVTKKYYDGLGRIFQTQVIGATVDGQAGKTIRTDTYYDGYGRAYRQSVPYVNTNPPVTDYEMDAAQKYTLTTYDVWGRTIQAKGTDNATTGTAYALFSLTNEMHQQVTTTDANGHTSVSLINTRGQVVKVQPQTGPAVTYSYDPLGQLTGSVYGTATPTSLTYDLAGQKTAMTDPDMGSWSYTYNGLGQLAAQTDAKSQTTTLYYDLLGRLTCKNYTGTDACTDSNEPKYTYAAQNKSYEQEFDATPPTAEWGTAGNVSFSGGQAHVVGNNTWNTVLFRQPYTIVDTKGTKLTFKVNAGAIFAISIEKGTGGTSGYRRWGISSDGQNLYRNYAEGSSGYADQLLMPLKSDTWYQLVLEDGKDRTQGKFRIVLLPLDANNASVAFTETHTDGWLDQNFHFVVQQYSGTMDIANYQELQYENKIQRRTGMTDASGSTTWDYDSRGRMTREEKTVTGAGTYTTTWTYNYADLPASMTYPTNEVVNFSYLNQLLPNAMSGTTGYVTGSQYDAASRTVQRNLGNSLITKYTYNGWGTDAGRLLQIRTGTSGNATSIQSLTYDYDAVGNISSIVDAKVTGGPQTQTFTYDAINRLITAIASGGSYGTYNTETYGYDTNGNLSSKAGLTLYYNNTDHDHAVSSTSGSNSWSFTYDANGNMITGNQSGNNLTYNYNAENQLVSVSYGQTAYTYDGDGNLVVMTDNNGVKTVRIGSYYEVVNPGASSTVRSYYFLGGVRVAMRMNDGSVTYFHTDHLGSVSAATNSSGSLLYTALYKPWGESRYQSTAPNTDYLYTGQKNVSTIGLYFYNARWFSSYLNRWTQPDFIVPDTYNVLDWDRYSYARNNPLKFNDPSGHAVACGTDAGNGCDGFGPSTIVKAGFDPEKTNEYLQKFMAARPDYRVEKDPLIYGKNEELLIRTAQFQVEVGKLPSFEEQLQGELEKPQYEPLLANQYTPVFFGAMSVLATDTQFLALEAKRPGIFLASWLVGRGAGIVSLASTGYQYQHNLYGTTKMDAEIAAATTLVGTWPKPDMAVMTHVGFLYTFFRTFGAIPSP
jgi:RHS repeat-associated protein